MKARAALAARGAILVVLAVLAWRATNHRSGVEPGTDSSIFLSMGWHASHGRTLYKDVWEQKPPLTFALNAAALTIGGDGVNSVRTMERGFAVLGVAAFFGAVLLAFRSFWIASATGLLFVLHMYRITVIEDGNVTEEYGTIVLLTGMFAAIASSRTRDSRSTILAGVSGLTMCLAVLNKEPFVLIAPAWFLWIAWPRGGDRKAARTRAASYALGVAVPVAVFLAYLTSRGALGAWIDTVAFSFAYTGAGPVASQSLTAMLFVRMSEAIAPQLAVVVAAVAGIAAATNRSFVRKHDGLPVVLLASALCSLLAATLGGRLYGHYFLFFVPSLMLLSASGMAFVADAVAMRRRWSVAALVAAAFLAVRDAQDWKQFATFVSVPVQRWPGHWLGESVRRNSAPDDPIWTPWLPLLYPEARRFSPSKWHNVFHDNFIDTPSSTAEGKLAFLRNELETHPPQVIVINPLPGNGPTRAPSDEFLELSRLRPWIDANYVSAMCGPSAQVELLVRKGVRAPVTARSSDSVAMSFGLAALYSTNDPREAVACFRLVLARTPQHYGATFQLAKALDAAGLTVDATAQWKRMLRLATVVGDATTLAVVRARLQ